jgi:hypothetical protein
MSEANYSAVVSQKYGYNKDTGEVFTKNSGVVSKRMDKYGYKELTINIDGKRYYLRAHRVAWFLHYGEWPDGVIDHINHNRKDNRICNLRAVTHHENLQNREPNKSGMPIGVRRGGKFHGYRARIVSNGKSIYLGSYETPSDAEYVYKKAYEHFVVCGLKKENFFVEVVRRLPEQKKPKPISIDIRVKVVREDGEIFESIGAAARSVERSPTSIRDVLAGKQKSAGGFFWKKLDT